MSEVSFRMAVIGDRSYSGHPSSKEFFYSRKKIQFLNEQGNSFTGDWNMLAIK